MFYQHLLYLKSVHITVYPLPLVYGLYACENDDCERSRIGYSSVL